MSVSNRSLSSLEDIPVNGIVKGPLGEAINNYLQSLEKESFFRGSVMVIKAGLPILCKGYGNATESSKNTPFTIFQIASLTKQFTAAAILQLHERGKIDLDAPITEYLPEDYQSEDWEYVKVKHLLSHTSGIPSYTDQKNYEKIAKSLTVEKIIKDAIDKTLYFEPGTEFEYSNTGYILLGTIIENVTGESYAQYMAENIFKPADMQSSGVCTGSSAKGSNVATGYCWDDDGEKLIKDDSENYSVSFSDGSIYSTVIDLAKWNEVLDGKRKDILNDEAIRMMTTPKKEEYGCGLIINEVFGQKRIFHDGMIAGFNDFLCKYPNDDTFIVVLCNTVGISSERVCAEISQILYLPKNEQHIPIPFPQGFDFKPYLKTFKSKSEDTKGEEYKFTQEDNRLYVEGPWDDTTEVALLANGRLLLLVDGYNPEMGEEYELDKDGNLTVYDSYGEETDYLVANKKHFFF